MKCELADSVVHNLGNNCLSIEKNFHNSKTMRRKKLEAVEIDLRCSEKLNPTIARNIGSMYKYSHGDCVCVCRRL